MDIFDILRNELILERGYLNVKKKHALFFIILLIFPIGILIMHVQPVLYFIGIVLSFIFTAVQSTLDLSKHRSADLDRSQAKLKRTMLIIALYLLGGFTALIFL